MASNPFDQFDNEIYARNAAYSKPAPAGGYLTKLSPKEETEFQLWVKKNNIPFDPSPAADYDMRGFWKGLKSGDEHATTGMNKNDGKLHFGDFYKTPYHKSFSRESQFATDQAPSWNENDQLVTADGRVVFDERAQAKEGTNPFDQFDEQPQQPAQQQSITAPISASDVGRQVGLTGRYAIEGLASIPGMVANVPASIADKLLELTGSDFRFGDQNQALSNALTTAGLPQPANATERVIGDATRAVSGAGGTIGVAGKVPGAISQGLQTRPGMQAVSAASGGTSAGVVRENGGGPIAQTVAGIAGGLAPYAALEGGKAVARGTRALVEPFTESGRKQVVGRALNEAATDPASAQARMANATEVVPGSKPTAAEVSKDYGIISAQRGAKASNPAAFAERSSDQNAARQKYLGVAAKDQPALESAITRRDAVTKPMRELAFKQAQGKPVDNDAMVQKIENLLADPDNAGETTQTALKWAKKQLEGKVDPRAVYAVRKDIAMKIAGKVSSEESVLRYAGKELGEVQKIIDDAIGAVAPAWKGYLLKYRQLSRPIDRMTNLQAAQGRAGLAAPDTRTGVDVLSQAKWKTQVQSLLDSGSLTKGQQTRVKAILDDLNRGAAINDPNIRAIGSNTTQDMTAANLLGQMLGSTKMAPFVRSMARPLQWLYKVPESEIKDLLTESLLDPKLGAELMKNASGAQMAKVSALLRQRFVASGLGTGAAAANQRQPTAEDTQPAAQ